MNQSVFIVHTYAIPCTVNGFEVSAGDSIIQITDVAGNNVCWELRRADGTVEQLDSAEAEAV